jgi:1,4-dihydroxy-2-naphthoyl-CoA hydrolase
MAHIWRKAYTVADIQALLGDDHAAAFLGLTLSEIGDDYIKATLPVVARTRQPFGLLHGGISCLVSESLGGIASWMCIDLDTQMAVGIEINANHIRAVAQGDISAICRPVHVGRSLHIWQTEIYAPSGKLACSSKLTCMVKEK